MATTDIVLIAAAVGGSIGAILVVGAAVYIGLKWQPKRSQYSPGQEYDTKSDQDIIGIPGPSNVKNSAAILSDNFTSLLAPHQHTIAEIDDK